jgi:hypothetical protein
LAIKGTRLNGKKETDWAPNKASVQKKGLARKPHSIGDEDGTEMSFKARIVDILMPKLSSEVTGAIEDRFLASVVAGSRERPLCPL